MTKEKKEGLFAKVSYASVLNGEARKLFLQSFLKKLNTFYIKYFGKEETRKVMGCIEKGILDIESPETYFFNTDNASDNSLELYNTSRNISDFFYDSLINFNRRAELGETNIQVREFFLAFADALSKQAKVIEPSDLPNYLRTLISSFSRTTTKSPFRFTFLMPEETIRLEETLGISTEKYHYLLKTFFLILDEFKEGKKLNLPKIEVLVPVYRDIRFSQLRYLGYALGLRKDTLDKELRGISLSEDTMELRIGLEMLMSMHNLDFSTDSIIIELQRIAKVADFKSYSARRLITDPFKDRGIPRSTLSEENVSFIYINREMFDQSFKPYFSNITLDCSSIKPIGNIEKYIDYAKNLSLLKDYYFKNFHFKYKDPTFKITLKNVKEYDQKFVDFVKDKIQRMKSLTNKEFIIDIMYNREVAERKAVDGEPTHFRVISDIHHDYNRGNKYLFNFGNDFILNCGDTGGDAMTCINWNKNYVKNGVVVAGNHLGYSPVYPELNGVQNIQEFGSFTHVENTKNNQIHEMSHHLHGLNGIRLLSNSMTEYNGVIILGTTLFTDFALFGKNRIEECMHYAKRYMNDFRYIYVVGHREYSLNPDGTWKIIMRKKSESKVRLFTPQDHAYFFHFSYNFLKEKVQQYKNKPIIIVTHHAPSPYSIAPEYKNDTLSAAFASNLNKFIIDNPQIRLWAHGHCIDDQTEVLTTKGWKTFYKIKESDTLLNLNTVTHKIEKDKINAIISKNYTGDVYHFQPMGSDIRVTSSHDMLTINKKTNKIRKIEAQDLYNKKQKFLIRAGVQEKEGLKLSDNLLRLLVWISADGNRPKENSNLTRFRLFKERKIKRLQELLSNLHIPYRTYYYSDKGGCSINFDLPQELQGMSFKPIDPSIIQCNQHQCSVILEEYANTDGTHNNNSIIIYTSKKEEADTIQLMCVTNNFGCSISSRVNHGFKLQSKEPKVSYELNIVSKPYRCIDNPHNTTTIEHVTDEHFWCLNTNNGTLIIRRNGKVNITGNCHSPVDYILGQTRVVCCPFGYNNENNFVLPNEYGVRIPIEDIKSKKPWTEIFKKQAEKKQLTIYTE